MGRRLTGAACGKGTDRHILSHGRASRPWDAECCQKLPRFASVATEGATLNSSAAAAGAKHGSQRGAPPQSHAQGAGRGCRRAASPPDVVGFDLQRARLLRPTSGHGKDASRAFATGDFTPAGLVDDVSGLSPSQMLAIQNWLSFYCKNYVHIGKVAGRFYQENGQPTKVLDEAQALIEEGEKLQAKEAERKNQFPPCNSEWSSAGGSRVWCSKQSGGISREWSGVPRKLYEPGSSRSHCVCIKTEELFPGQEKSTWLSNQGKLNNPNLQEYEGCHPLSEWCALKE